jgi:hypothetical protein
VLYKKHNFLFVIFCRIEEDASQEKITLESSDVAGSTNETPIGNNCFASKECPCMHGKLFLHVMAPGFGEDGIPSSNKPWKQRYVI